VVHRFGYFLNWIELGLWTQTVYDFEDKILNVLALEPCGIF